MGKRPDAAGRRACRDCGAALPERTGPGRPPVRCDACRKQRRHRAGPPPAGPRLTVVRDVPEPVQEPWDAPQPWQVAREEAAAAALAEGDPLDDVDDEPGGLAGVVARDLAGVFSGHPAAATLGALAQRLARAIDEPGVDGRTVAAVTRELRATLADLVAAEEDEDDDLFGDGGAAPVVVPETG